MDRRHGVICMMLAETRGLGQFGKGRSRRWYKRQASKRLRREARRAAQA